VWRDGPVAALYPLNMISKKGRKSAPRRADILFM
jgi:hypothetical protein